MERPYIICHMVTSIDGKVTGPFLNRPECAPGVEDYYRINRDFAADAYACGRITMEGSFTGGWQPDLTPFDGEQVEREDFVGDAETDFFAVAFDRRGRLGWKASCIEDEDPGYGGAHIIEVLCEDASDAYLAYLRSIGVSYLFAGKQELDLPQALAKLRERFGIQTLLLEGGSVLNRAFQQSEVIDELSLVMVPLTARGEDKSLFNDGVEEPYCLREAKTLDSGAVWLRYEKK